MGAVESTITCPKCRAQIPLTESIAAPLIEATRQQYEQRLTQQNADVAKREQQIKEREAAIAKQKESVDTVVAEKLKLERTRIAAETTKREQAFAEREAAIAREREAVDASVAEKVKLERARIAAEEEPQVCGRLVADLFLAPIGKPVRVEVAPAHGQHFTGTHPRQPLKSNHRRHGRRHVLQRLFDRALRHRAHGRALAG
jgi:hypothetical protein